MRKSDLRFVLAALLSLAALSGSAQQSSTDGKQQYAALGACKLVSGKQIAGCFIGYRTWGKLNAQRSNAILFPTWFSGRSSNIAPSVGADSLVDRPPSTVLSSPPSLRRIWSTPSTAW